MGIKHSQRPPDERGANLVEFAVLAPLLILLVLGIVEFGWLFAQNNAVRHSAGEASRFASVDGGTPAGTTVTEIAQRACNDLLGTTGITSFDATLDNGGGAFGADASVTVSIGVTSLSGAPLITSFLPTTLDSTATFRLEQAASWTPVPNPQTINLDPATCT